MLLEGHSVCGAALGERGAPQRPRCDADMLVPSSPQACRARGMRGPFGEGAVAFMRRQLQDWLDLSLHRGLPSSLLLLSRAFTITASVQDVAQKKWVWRGAKAHKSRQGIARGLRQRAARGLGQLRQRG